ncbi:PEP-CTERM sorting domain-containing protein [Methylophilus sp. Q8]|uniref:PEP-CTERM sorting domain-containing protein n=1 Tax=Methylophilus sp. Q8 TaxID=1506586 RepID=UPI000648E4D5|nr:PEP-CTERM sorting domain-containing protein [Methylophilus sp. Q8]
MKSLHKVLTAAGLLLALPAHALTIEFDYTYDTRGFFTDLTTGTPMTERRALLEQAASFYSGFTDALTAITPQAGDSWSVQITHPSLGGPLITLSNIDIAADTLRIYVGGSNSAPGVLGFANTGFNLTASGSDTFIDAVTTRGQENTIGSTATDYGVWGGMIWFNAANDWYFGSDTSGLTAGHPDFLTTATHELGHILGYGEADSWLAQIDSGYFTGAASVAAYGSAVPLDQYGSHWANGTMSSYQGVAQETLMDPSTTPGTRELPTLLDYAAFKDIGWQVNVTTVPEPDTYALLLTGLALIGLSARRRAV